MHSPGVSVEIFCWGSRAYIMWISKGSKQILQSCFIEIQNKFSNVWGALDPQAKFHQGPIGFTRALGPKLLGEAWQSPPGAYIKICWWRRLLKSFLIETRTHSSYKYHGCWWPDNSRNQCISKHGFQLVGLEDSSLSIRGWTCDV